MPSLGITYTDQLKAFDLHALVGQDLDLSCAQCGICALHPQVRIMKGRP
jgi:hypothetical protein